MAGTVPHQFARFRSRQRRPTLVVSSGLSHALVPLAATLFEKQRENAEAELGCASIACTKCGAEGLYEWAGKVLDNIPSRSGPSPRLRLAESLGILRDEKWRAAAGHELHESAPRHRVIARFARERLWDQIWSLNWDCLLEVALEQVGYSKEPAKGRQPWLTAYATIVLSEDASKLGDDGVFCVVKPHGCVRALVMARSAFNNGNITLSEKLASRFLITENDLFDKDSKDLFVTRLFNQVLIRPLMMVGWSASEKYIQKILSDAANVNIAKASLEELTIIDVAFNAHHQQLAALYELTQSQVHAHVSKNQNEFCTDKLFLWIQAKYALDMICEHASEDVKAQLEWLVTHMADPTIDHFILDWADYFLPSWVRLCWRAETVTCVGYSAHEISAEQADEHIPWNIPGIPRFDLEVAAVLLAQVGLNVDAWDLGLVKGAMLHKQTRELIVPLPAAERMNYLAALGPLSKQVIDRAGFISTISILPISNSQLSADALQRHGSTLRTAFANVLQGLAYTPEDIGIVAKLPGVAV